MTSYDPSGTALLLMDFQQGIVDRLGDPAVLEAAAHALEAARAAGAPVVHVRVAFRPGYPEVSADNRSFAAIATGAGDFTESSPQTRVHAALAPGGGEPVVVKRRVSAFTGSDLEVVLRARGVRTLALAGIATSGVVLSTLREAADRDFRLAVLSDACADGDPEVHRVLLGKVFPRQAEVLTVAQWAAGIG
ncbi:cysteine hydrolase family protein [Actinacidiphila sp. ITFR-21]|uniref:cysteine hydrolase family protein n=1 Tax=Actinacidiphila sp. ITFR-21 TaxID=3075199 RepID=UPI00288A6077|nr:isochorismatase family cysteine hydrolase [Streptomyces sp. ITFR-21]WNI18199.1 isochorismatase family cysteine hydrolase [Streptomyces sp. ITFR-21]